MLIGSFGPFLFLAVSVFVGWVPETHAPARIASMAMPQINVAGRILIVPFFGNRTNRQTATFSRLQEAHYSPERFDTQTCWNGQA